MNQKMIQRSLFKKNRDFFPTKQFFSSKPLGHYTKGLIAGIILMLTAGMLYAQNCATINVKDKGAMGDGITDDTQAIQNAFNDAKTFALQNQIYGVTVYFPAGVYKTTSTLTIPLYVNLSGENTQGTIIDAKFNGDAIQDATLNGASIFWFTEISNLTILKSNTNGTDNSTGCAIKFRHNANYCRFHRLRITGGDYAIWSENLGYSLWNTYDQVICYYQQIANVYIGQGSSVASFNNCSFNYSPIGVDMKGMSVGVSFHGCSFESYTDCAIQVENAQISVFGGYFEQKDILVSTVKMSGSGNLEVNGAYLRGAGAGYLATMNGNGTVTFRDCQISNFPYTWPVIGTYRENVTLIDNQPTVGTTDWVRGYKDFTGSFSTPPACVSITHGLDLPKSKINTDLYVTPTSGYMNGKEVKVCTQSGCGPNGYTVWKYDNNTLQVRTAKNGGLIYDTVTNEFGGTGVSGIHNYRLRITVH